MKLLYILAEEQLEGIFKVLLVTRSSPPTTAFLQVVGPGRSL